MPVNSSISSEIDAIIARAMAEYSAAKGVDVFSEPAERVDAVETPPEESVIREEPETPPAIPQNSHSLLIEETTSRFSGAVWFDNVRSKNVTLAGLGGIGSYVAFLLSRLHIHQLFIYDNDVVEAGNMSGQFYSRSQIGRTKVSGTIDNMSSFSDFYDVFSYEEQFTNRSQATDIMICGFDSMEARRTFYNKWKAWVDGKEEEYKKDCLFIDGRLAAEHLQVLCIRGDDAFNMSIYEKDFLFSDSEADETTCSYKQTTFMANMIASIMVNLFVNFCANECDPLVPRDMPFFTEYNAETFFFKVKN